MTKYIFICFTIILTFSLSGCSNNNSISNNTDNNYDNSISSQDTDNNYSVSRTLYTEPPKNIETELATFSTKVTIKDPGRQHNIQITCSVLDGTVIKAGETFSFCDVVGQATPERGYEKADVFDSDGNIIQGYGGGNCQISSTLYNAVLELPSLTVVERHAHSRKVYYVEADKDAAVSYGSVDFKFKNTNDFDIKIYCSATEDEITVKIVKI